MDTETPSPEVIRRHVVAVPYPGRGHINPMLNLCKLLSSKNPHLLITFVVTDEWRGFLSGADSTSRSNNIQLASIPNVIPSELVRGSDFPAFYAAVMTKMESPFDQLLDRISDPPITAMISDTELRWAIRIGNRRNIPVATLCTVPAGVFSLFNRFAAIQDLQLRDKLLDEEVDCSSAFGISPPGIADLQAIFRGDDRKIMGLTLECISWVPKAQYLLVNSVQELEPEAFDSLRSEFNLPIYPIGPTIPFFQLNHNETKTVATESAPAYFKWLDSQPEGSVLYVSLGSFLSISSRQMDEIAAGLKDSSVNFLWVARGESERVKERCGEKGIVVPWCDQLKVLSHCSVGGFLTHCGWNSTLEAIYCGVPMLTFPLIFDQVPNSRKIVEKWKLGWRLKRDVVGNEDELVTRGQVCEVVKRFMNGEESGVKELRKRGKQLREICRQAVAEGGSSDKNLDEFIKDISGASCTRNSSPAKLQMESKTVCHLVAMPFPGRGHINPMMNLCKLLAWRRTNLLMTFVVTEEWLGYIGSEPKPEAVQFKTIANGIIPPERLKAVDFPGFYEAVMTEMESPFEQLLDQLQPPVTAIMGDVEVRWAVGVGNRRNIPVAAFWTMPASFFSMLYHLDVSAKGQSSSPKDLLDCGEPVPGVSTSQASELKKLFQKNDHRVLQLAMDCVSEVTNAQYLLFTSIYELEVQTMDSLSQTFTFPVYSIGPAIPYLELLHQNPSSSSIHQWLDDQPKGSVLYISLGSFLSVSSAQMDEILEGLTSSGVRFLWVARGEASRLNQKISGSQKGMVVGWCDQLKVLSHRSVGGFWSHCGWNSTLESVFCGVPMLTFPLFLDQDSNSKMIVEEWGVGWELVRTEDNSIGSEEIGEAVRKFMSLESEEGQQMRRRAREVGDICNRAVSEDGGSSVNRLDAFIAGISPAV